LLPAGTNPFDLAHVAEEGGGRSWAKKGSISTSRIRAAAERASIEEKTTGLMTALKDDRGKIAEKDLIAEAAWPGDGVRIAGTKMEAGTEAASNGEIFSGNNAAGRMRRFKNGIKGPMPNDKYRKNIFFKHQTGGI
jgi:hypothetical protein